MTSPAADSPTPAPGASRTTASVLTAELRAQKQREIRIASKYRGDFAWRIVFEMIWGMAAWAGVIALAVSGALSYWIATPLLGWIAYLMYMPLHEATHGNVHGAHAKLRKLDDVVGHISSIPLWFSFSAHRISHMHHHAYANDPQRDPDYFLAGSFGQLIPKNVVLAILQTIVPVLVLVPGGLRILPRSVRELAMIGRDRRIDDELRHGDRFVRLCFAVFVGLSLAGFFREALLLWWLPGRIGMFWMSFLFAWLPHHPFADTGRYTNTRITLFPGSRQLIRGQDRHLLHHMFPRVPHYRLPALFDELRPDLEARGARIEGPLAGPNAPKIALRWSSAAG